jgi:hypothetical protein
MQSAIYRPVVFALLFFFSTGAGASAQKTKHEKPEKHEQTIWNYDGGVFFVTDGSLPNGVCFRINGRMNSGDFFDGLKRIDTDRRTFFQRGSEIVTHFPDAVIVFFSIRDEVCPAGVQQVGTRAYLTQKMMEDLRLSIYWKQGVDLHPVKDAKRMDSRVDRIQPYAAPLAAELPARYEWSYEFVVPSAGVSLLDSLAIVFRTPDGRIAARVAARL